MLGARKINIGIRLNEIGNKANLTLMVNNKGSHKKVKEGLINMK